MEIDSLTPDATGAALRVGDTVLVPMHGDYLERGKLLYFNTRGYCVVELSGPSRRRASEVIRAAKNVVLVVDR